MAKRRKRRANLGYPAEKHRGLIVSFAHEATRQAERAARMSSCRLAMFHYGAAERHLGAAVAHADSLQGNARQDEKNALVVVHVKVKAAREEIARRCGG
jgi:hypothetical protein